MTVKKQKANNLLMPFSGVLMGVAIILLTILIIGSLGAFDMFWNNNSLAGNIYEIDQFLSDLNNLQNANNETEFLEKLSSLINQYQYGNVASAIQELDWSVWQNLTSLYEDNKPASFGALELDQLKSITKEIYDSVVALDIMSHIEYTWKSSVVSYVLVVLAIILAITNFSMKKKANDSVSISNNMWYINLAGFLVLLAITIGTAVLAFIEMNNSFWLFDAKSEHVFTLMIVGLIWILFTLIFLWISYLVIYKQKSELVSVATNNNVMGAPIQEEPKLSPLEAKIKKLEMKMKAKENPGSESKELEFTTDKKLLFIGSIISMVITSLAILMVSIISLPLMIIYIIPSIMMYPLLIATLTLSIMTFIRVKNNISAKKLFLATGIVSCVTAFIGLIFMIVFYSILFGFFLPLIAVGGVLMLVGSLIKK